ncbi:MAG: recombinase [Clostridia bacterium]|nr:recombinase [Clostridia bacterium]
MQVNNSLTQTQEKKQVSFSNFLTNPATRQRIWDIVGKDSQKFMTSILSAVTNNPTLQECDQMSVLNCAFLGQALNLVPSPQLGQYYMVPFKNKKKNCTEAQFQLGYKGYIQLAIRSGYYKKITVLSIKEGELIRYDPLAEEIEVNLIEDDEVREETETVGYYAMFEYQNGFRKTLYWTKKKMLAHADRYSQAFNKEVYQKILTGNIPQEDMWKYSSFWYKDFDGMAYKTMLRQLISKWGIMSTEMQEAYSKDMAVLDDQGNPYFIENDQEQKPESIIIEAKKSTVVEQEEQQDIKESEQKENTGELPETIKRTRKTKTQKETEQETENTENQEQKSIEDEFFA